MKKRVITLLLGSSMLLGLLGGCGSAQETSEKNQAGYGKEAEETKTAGESSADGEIVEIFWQYPSSNEVQEGFYRMEDALNEMMEKDIGVHVTFIPTGLMESQQDATLMVSTGEQLDVMLTAFTSVGNLVDAGLILPLDDYVEEYGQDILKHAGAKVEGCYYDGTLYGVPTCAESTANSYGYCMKKSYADKYGFTQDDNKVYTLDEIEEMFAIVKEGEGDNFYMTVPWLNTYEPLNYSYQEYDMLSGSFSAGVLMLNRDFKDLTIYNFFETQEYKEYCERMYDWVQKGYIAPDAAVDSDYGLRGAQDNYLGWFGHCAPTSKMNYLNSTWGQEVVQFRTVDGFIRVNGGCSVQWNVPVTSGNPTKAMEAINYVMANKEAANLIQYGFEGEEYEVVEQDEEGHIVVKMLADDISTLPYYNAYGLWGDRYEIAQLYPNTLEDAKTLKVYDATIPESRKSAALGYCFVQTEVSAEIAAVETVMEQYCYSFNAGALNPDEALPDFISALKAAGIDKIIEENQRQLDQWAESR